MYTSDRRKFCKKKKKTHTTENLKKFQASVIKVLCEQRYGESGLPKGNVSTLLTEMSQVVRERAFIRAHLRHVHSLRGEISVPRQKEQRINSPTLPKTAFFIRHTVRPWGFVPTVGHMTRCDILH